MNAHDLMTPDVVTVLPDMPVVAIARLMAERGISAVPVADARRQVVGVVSEGDLIRHVAGENQKDMGLFAVMFSDPHRLAAEYAKAHGRTARDVMTTALVSVPPTAAAEEIARLMAQKKVRRVLVMDGDRLAGVVSRADLLRAVLTPATAQSQSDEAIRRQIRDEMRQLPWVSSHLVTVMVKDGVVTLHGLVGSPEIGRGLETLAAGVGGVTKVENRTEIGPAMPYSLA